MSGNPCEYEDVESAVKVIRQLENELKEFQVSSLELEKELDYELDNMDKQNNLLKDEVRELKEEVNELKKELVYKQQMFENEMGKLKVSNEAKDKKIIDLEIKNDSLEQNERVLRSNIADLSDRFAELQEQNIILTNELSESNLKLIKQELIIQNNLNSSHNHSKATSFQLELDVPKKSKTTTKLSNTKITTRSCSLSNS